MKKIKYVFLFIFILSLCGCISESKRDQVLDVLRDKKYIQEDWELVEKTTTDGFGSDITELISYNYIMKDKDDKYYVVSIYNTESKPKENYYEIEIYSDVIYIPKDDSKNRDNCYEFPRSKKRISLKKKGLTWKAEVLDKKDFSYEEASVNIYSNSRIKYYISDSSIIEYIKEEKVSTDKPFDRSYYFRAIKSGETEISFTRTDSNNVEKMDVYTAIVNERGDLKILYKANR